SAEIEPQLSTSERQAILDTTDMDTGKISIWEVFGVQRPSETQQMRAVQLAQEQAAVLDAEQSADRPAVEERAVPPKRLTVPEISEAPRVPDVVASEALTPPALERPVVLTQEMRSIEPIIAMPSGGLRIRQRRKLVKVRRK